MTDAKTTLEIIIAATDQSGAAFSSAVRGVESFSGSIGTAFQPMADLAGGILAIDAALAAVAVGGLLVFSDEVITAGQSMHSLRAVIDASVGSSEAGALAFEEIRAKAYELGINLETAGGGFKMVAAASKGSILEGQGTLDIFNGISTAGAALGLSNDALQGSFIALAQMISKGKITAEEWNGQLAERLPGATNIAAKALGVTSAEFFNLMQNGDLTLESLSKIGKALEDAFKDQVKNIDPLLKATANLSTAWFEFKAKLYDDIGMDKALAPVVDAIKNLFAGGLSDEVKKSLQNLLATASDYALKMIQVFPAAFDKLDFSKLISALKGLGGVFTDSLGEIDLTTPEGLARVLQQLIDAATTFTKVNEGLFTALLAVMGVVGEIVLEFTKLDEGTQASIGWMIGGGAAISVTAGAIGTMAASVRALQGAWALMAANPVVLAIIAAGGVGFLIGEKIGDAIYGTDQLAASVGKLPGALEKCHASSVLTKEGIDGLKRSEAEIKAENDKLIDAMLATGPAIDGVTLATRKSQAQTSGWVETLVDGVRTFNQVGNGIGVISSAADRTTQALDAVAKQSKETENKMLDLASNERIKAMEFSAELEIAGLETSRDIVVSSFDSINAAITSTGETMSSLWGTLASGGLSFTESWKLQDTLSAEEKRRQGIFDRQEKLLAAETKLAEARADAIRNRGNTIDFKFTGASPFTELAAIELLKAARIYVTGEGGAFLLGLGD